MSRIAKMPVVLPAGVQVSAADGKLTVKGVKASVTVAIPATVKVEVNGNVASISADSIKANGMAAGTARALLNNAVIGVSKGYEKRLALVGVGYRAAVQGKKLNLSLGFSHPIEYAIPDGVVVETPSQTEIVVKGADKKLVGQVAADIRGFRPPEPYKGKGVRYATEKVVLKEAKKK
ncbi:large subunit ribosomal protein L6 [Fontimonas thermophila]|uniref:Large ribosomal subunit protein uL6 n=1 Tax=Fontimonas thermophila TaxID=1076937 RepID=A0A1I2K1R0_9GAMM|nr:50S ribosomal protein L6 [Fontimonas thermophila]SFF60110.1 large subunit ribosomal protein L6 [Fontimonas thermophila]